MFRLVIAIVCFSLVSGIAISIPVFAKEKYVVEVYQPDKVYPGTTIFGDTSNPKKPLIVEIDMAGKIRWSYEIPSSIVRKGDAARGMDVEWIPKSDNILYVFPYSGIYEVNRNKKTVWSFSGSASHDADRLPNGNTLVVWGWGEDSKKPEVYELDPKSNVVWEWYAEEHVKNLKQHRSKHGFTHTNAAVRLKNGNTLISLRNFFALVEVDTSGKIVWKLENLFRNPHDPEELLNGNILVNTRRPQVIKEYNKSGEIVWQHYPEDADTIRYNHKLPNGNIIFAERRKIVEITPNGEVVWQLRLNGVSKSKKDKNRWFYKADRKPQRGKTN
jgi:hypothetical protein